MNEAREGLGVAVTVEVTVVLSSRTRGVVPRGASRLVSGGTRQPPFCACPGGGQVSFGAGPLSGEELGRMLSSRVVPHFGLMSLDRCLGLRRPCRGPVGWFAVATLFWPSFCAFAGCFSGGTFPPSSWDAAVAVGGCVALEVVELAYLVGVHGVVENAGGVGGETHETPPLSGSAVTYGWQGTIPTESSV